MPQVNALDHGFYFGGDVLVDLLIKLFSLHLVHYEGLHDFFFSLPGGAQGAAVHRVTARRLSHP